MSHDRPIVSVLLPVRNGGAYLRDAVESVLSQDFPALELLVIDDGSTDGAVEPLRAHRDPRLRFLSSSVRGLSAALNLGLAASAGVYVARQDADDLSLPGRLRKQAACLDTNTDIDIVATRVEFIDGTGGACRTAWTDAVDREWDRALTPSSIAALLPLTCCLIHGSVMARREVLMRVGGYRDDMTVAQDYDLWLRLLPEHRFAKLAERLYAFRLHDRQVSATKREQQSKAAIDIKLRHLRRVMGVPNLVCTVIFGFGRGADLYRRALSGHNMVEVDADDRWDVGIFTDFATLDAEIARVEAAMQSPAAIRVGNFLIRLRRAA